MIPHTHEILKKKKFHRKWVWGGAKTFKGYFLETIFMTKLWDTRGSNSDSFSSTDFKFGSLIAKYQKFKTVSVFFWISKNFLSDYDKSPPLSITKVLFRSFGCKIQTKRPFKKTLTRFWTVNSVKYENAIIGAIKRITSDLELRKGKTKVDLKIYFL